MSISNIEGEARGSREFGLWREQRPPTAVTIAGFDPSSGAGIAADIRTFDCLGIYGEAVVTTITYQSTLGMTGRFDLAPEVVTKQLEALFSDRKPMAMKTGALGALETVKTIGDFLSENLSCPLVVDPVFHSSGGSDLIEEEALGEVVDKLLPLATVVTPNVSELSKLAGLELFDLADVQAAVLRVFEMGVKAVLVKGFPLEKGLEKVACDLYYDGVDFTTHASPWITDERVHGTGCVLSAALAANLALGRGLRESVELARDFVLSSKRKAITPGSGVPCVNPFAALEIENGGMR